MSQNNSSRPDQAQLAHCRSKRHRVQSHLQTETLISPLEQEILKDFEKTLTATALAQSVPDTGAEWEGNRVVDTAVRARVQLVTRANGAVAVAGPGAIVVTTGTITISDARQVTIGSVATLPG